MRRPDTGTMRDRRPFLPLVLHLYRHDATFRGFLDLAAIGLVVLLFLHPLQLARLVPTSGTASQKAWIPLQDDQPKLPTATEETEAKAAWDEFKKSIFSDFKRPSLTDAMRWARNLRIPHEQLERSTPAARAAIEAAVKESWGNIYKAISIFENADSTDPNIAFLHGVYLMATMETQNIYLGVKKLEFAAERGQPQAKARLGLFLLVGIPGTDRDTQRGEKLLIEATNDGEYFAARVLGHAYLLGWSSTVDRTKAGYYFKLGIKTGEADAEYDYAAFLSQGPNKEQDMPEIERLLTDAGERGHHDAQFLLGSIYFVRYLTGVVPDPSRAVDWLGRAADSGNPAAMALLAQMHLEHAKEPPWRDSKKGIALYKKCAELFFPPCLYGMAVAYDLGVEVDHDLAHAYAYYSIARQSGQMKAKQRLAELEKAMTPEEIEAGTALALDLAREAPGKNQVIPGFR